MKITALGEEKSGLQMKVSALSEEKSDLQMKLSALSEEKSDLQRQISALGEEKSDLQMKVSALRQEGIKLTDHFQKTLDSLEQIADAKGGELSQLINHIQSAQTNKEVIRQSGISMENRPRLPSF